MSGRQIILCKERCVFANVHSNIQTHFHFSQNPSAFSTKCVQLIGKCFRDLETLSIGGHEIDLSALTFVGEFIPLVNLNEDINTDFGAYAL